MTMRRGHLVNRPHMVYTEVGTFEQALDILKMRQRRKPERRSQTMRQIFAQAKYLRPKRKREQPPPSPELTMEEMAAEIRGKYANGSWKPHELACHYKIRVDVVKHILWGEDWILGKQRGIV